MFGCGLCLFRGWGGRLDLYRGLLQEGTNVTEPLLWADALLAKHVVLRLELPFPFRKKILEHDKDKFFIQNCATPANARVPNVLQCQLLLESLIA